LFFSLGPHFRMAHFRDWDLWTLNLDVQWLAPLGLFRFSLGVPLNAHKGDNNPLSPGYNTKWADQTEVFQFSIGQAF